jgi:hypothetical protein
LARVVLCAGSLDFDGGHHIVRLLLYANHRKSERRNDLVDEPIDF